LKAYWRTCGYRHGNFGDELTPFILQEVLGVVVERAHTMEEADLISVGSILSEIPVSYSQFVWGTGAMFEESAISLSDAKVRAVRGLLTRCRIPQATPSALGDPALLANLIPTSWDQCVKYELSILPHYVDMNDDELCKFLRRNPDVHVIDPCQPVLQVLRDIQSSQAVLSSSLHGLIVADAYGVRNGWTKLSDKLSGGTFKFHDYSSLYQDEVPTPIVVAEDSSTESLVVQTRTRERAAVSSIRDGLLAAFPAELRDL